MQTFPSIEPVYVAAKDTSPLTAKTNLGDGYKKKISFGLNTIKPEWQVDWVVSTADASAINIFLKSRGADGEWFYWTPPDGTTSLKWRCDEWTMSHEAESLVRVSASFRQVLELEYAGFEAAAAICLDDDLCEQDFGDISDAWVARLRGSRVRPTEYDFLSYKSNCYSFDNGYIYLAFGYGTHAKELHLAKFSPSGRTIWVKQIGFTYKEQYEGGAISMAADEANQRLFLGVQGVITFPNDVRPGFGYEVESPSYTTISIDAVSGKGNWIHTWVNTVWTNNCYGIAIYNSTRVGNLRFNPIPSENFPEGKLYSTSYQGFGENQVMSLDPAYGGYAGAARYATDYTLIGGGTYNPGQSAIVVDRGLLGYSFYTVTKYVRGGVTISLGNYDYPYQTGRRTSGRVHAAKFLKNRQLFLWFSTNEIMIIGPNVSIVDHVKFPPAIVNFPENSSYYSTIPKPFLVWPSSEGEPGDENSALSPSNDYEVVLVAQESKIYMTYPASCGTTCVVFSVTMNGSLVQSIDSISVRIDSSSTSLNQGGWTGAAKYSSNKFAQPRITGAIGGGSDAYWGYSYREVAVSSIKRSNLNTNAEIVTFGVGSSSSATVGPNASFRAAQTNIIPTRVGLEEYIIPGETRVPGSETLDGFLYESESLDSFVCGGNGAPRWTTYYGDIQGDYPDVTDSVIFDLYTHSESVD